MLVLLNGGNVPCEKLGKQLQILQNMDQENDNKIM